MKLLISIFSPKKVQFLVVQPPICPSLSFSWVESIDIPLYVYYTYHSVSHLTGILWMFAESINK